jgi:hypothetical protein
MPPFETLSMEVDGPTLLSVVPMALHQHGQRTLEVIGSAVLVEIFGQGVLLTAAHVLDELANGRLFIPGPEGRFVEANGPCFCSEAPSKARTGDPMDMGFIFLGPADQIPHDPRTRPLQEADIAFDMHSLDGLNMYTFVGYPWRKTQTHGQDLVADPERFSGIGQDALALKRHGLDVTRHIAINFHRRKSSHGRSQRVMAPLPHGISGGGIYAWSKAPKGIRPIPAGLQLVGIAHTWLEAECLLVGTRIEWLVAEIYRAAAALNGTLQQV